MNFKSQAFRSLPPLERIMLRSEWQGPCLVFTGPRKKGYGTLTQNRKQHTTHRLAWELLVGPIPDDMTLDHLCRNKACWWSDHLEVVSDRVNILRGYGPPALGKRKTHCKRDHEFTPENTRIDLRGFRSCWTCHYERKAVLV